MMFVYEVLDRYTHDTNLWASSEEKAREYKKKLEDVNPTLGAILRIDAHPVDVKLWPEDPEV